MMIDPDGRYTSQIQSLKDSMPNIYSGWEYVEGINFGDWHNFASGAQFSAFVQYVAANGGGGGSTTFGETPAYAAAMDAWRNGQSFNLINKGGYLYWNTLDAANANGMLADGSIGGVTAHSLKLGEDNSSSGVGQPGEWESLIPIWGSGRAAVDHFQNGNYWRGLGYTALAVSDVFLVKSLATMAVRGTITLASKHVLKQAVKNPILTTREAYRLAVTESKGVAALMKGKGIDRAFREGAARNWILNPAQKAGLIQINPMNKGADVVGKRILEGTWWDITTFGSWQSHVNKYGAGGIGLFY